jgi:hypothetical protein
LIYIGTSVVVLLFTYTYTSIRSYYRLYNLRLNAPKPLVTTDDEFSDEEVVDEEVVDEDEGDHESEYTLTSSLPKDTKVSIIEDPPAHERLWVGAEITLLLAEIGLSIFSIIKGEGWRSITVAGLVQWVCLLLIGLLRFLGTKRTKSLWMHSMLIYLFSWPIAFMLLRSAILHHGDFGVGIANFCLVTGLCGLVLTSRAGNKPVKLVSTNDLEPSRVHLF